MWSKLMGSGALRSCAMYRLWYSKMKVSQADVQACISLSPAPTHAPSHPTHAPSHPTHPSHPHMLITHPHTHHTPHIPITPHTCLITHPHMPITHTHMPITHHPHICRRTKRTRGYPLEYLTSLVLRVSKSTVLSNCASTFATRICSNSLFTTSSSWNRQSTTKNASSGNTLSSKIIRKSLISCQPSH